MNESQYFATYLALRACESGDQLYQVNELGERAVAELVRAPKRDEDDDENNQPFELDQ